MCQLLGYNTGVFVTDPWVPASIYYAQDDSAYRIGQCFSPEAFPACGTSSGLYCTTVGAVPMVEITCDGNTGLTEVSCTCNNHNN